MKDCEFESWQEWQENFLLQSQLCVLTLIRCRSNPVLPQRHVKDPGHSAKSAGGRLHLNTHTPLTQRSRSGLTVPSRLSVKTYEGSDLTRNASGNTRPQSSQLAKPLWTDPRIMSGISVRDLISTLKKKKQNKKQKTQAGNEWSNIVQKSSQTRIKPPTCF